MTESTLKELDEDSKEYGELIQLITSERKFTSQIILTTWILGIIGAIAGVILLGWVWGFILAIPVIVNALVVNKTYHRIARDTGIEVETIHKLWRLSQSIDMKTAQWQKNINQKD